MRGEEEGREVEVVHGKEQTSVEMRGRGKEGERERERAGEKERGVSERTGESEGGREDSRRGTNKWKQERSAGKTE